jgi:hypothetical protein
LSFAHGTRGESAGREPIGPGLDRRSLLGRLLGLGVVFSTGGAWLALGCSRAELACYDPELLSTAERSARRLRSYVDVASGGDAKRCGGCDFFEPGDSAGCGRCSILAGPVSATGVCDAWSERTAG